MLNSIFSPPRLLVLAALAMTLVLTNAGLRAAPLAAPATPASSDLTFSDSLLPTSARPEGAALDKTDFAKSPAKWSAAREITITARGAVPSGPGGGHCAIPVIAGQLRVQAELSPTGCGYTALAFGRGNLSGDFWRSLRLMVTLAANGEYQVFGAGQVVPGTSGRVSLRAESSAVVVMTLDTVARTVSVQIDGTPCVQEAPLPEAIQLDGITAAGFRFQEPVTAGRPSLTQFEVALHRTASAGLEPTDLAMCFVTPGQPANLRWRVASPGPAGSVPYVISDFHGPTPTWGKAALGADGLLTLQLTFPRGYAEITFPEANQTFGIVSQEPGTGAADPFFGIDAALTQLEQDPARREALVRIMARCGIAMARERFGGVFAGTPGAYTWEGPRALESLRGHYAAQHLPLLEMLYTETRSFGLVKGQAFPQNLAVMATEWTGVVRHWQAIWGGAEVYNEPDLKNVPAEQYAPMAKTLSYALAQAECRVPLVTGVVATMPPGPYFDALAANGLLADSDVFSFHSYDKASDIEQMVTRFREWLKKSDRESLPLWQTECGKAWANGPPRPPLGQDALSACEISAMAIESRACGVARYFPFVYVYYEEGGKNFGMMGREATPLRSMAAYAQCIHALAGTQYLGDVLGSDPAIKRARAFAATDSAEAVVTLYTGQIDPEATVSFPLPALRIEGADGAALLLVGAEIPIPDGLTYVWVKKSELARVLQRDTRAARLHQLGQNPVAPKRLASPVVLQFLAQNTPAQTSARRYLLAPETARALPITVRLHNLSSTPVEATPALTLPGGQPMTLPTVTLPAVGFVDVAWQPDATASLDLAETRFITITAQVAGALQPSPLAIPFTMEGTLEQHLARHPHKMALPITDLSRWLDNTGNGKAKFVALPDGTWRAEMAFSGVRSNWSYPRFTLSEPIDPARDRGFLLRARTLKPGRPAVIAKTEIGGDVSFWVPDIFPGDGAWHVVYLPFGEFKPGPGGAGDQNTRLDVTTWKLFEIGMGTSTADNALEVSHLLIVGGSGPPEE